MKNLLFRLTTSWLVLLHLTISVPTHGVEGSEGIANLADEWLESEAERLMAKYHVPGLGMAIVMGNETWTKGFGVATLPSTPSTPNTLFGIGSNTKSMTGYLWGLLAAEKAPLDPLGYLNTPLSVLLKDIPGGDDFVFATRQHTTQLTPLDLLTHRTGYVGRVEVAGYLPEARGTVGLLRWYSSKGGQGNDGRGGNRDFVPGGGLVPGFRDKWRYNNQMYLAAGYALSLLRGQSLDELLREQLFAPAGMETARLGYPFESNSSSSYNNTSQIATQYFHVPSPNTTEPTYLPRSPRPLLPVDAAGGILASPNDLSHYLRFLLQNSVVPSFPLLTLADSLFVTAPHQPTSNPPLNLWALTNGTFAGTEVYGLGWVSRIVSSSPFGGATECWWHNGGVATSFSEIWICPALRLGVAVATASGIEGDIPGILALSTVLRAAGISVQDLPPMEAQADAAMEALEVALVTCKARLFPNITGVTTNTSSSSPSDESSTSSSGGANSTTPSSTIPLSNLAGTYTNPAFASITLTYACSQPPHLNSPSSPANITLDSHNCFIKTQPIYVPGSLYAGELEHAEGDSYVVWIYDADLPDYHRPQPLCFPAYFSRLYGDDGDGGDYDGRLMMKLHVSTESEAEFVSFFKEENKKRRSGNEEWLVGDL